MFSNIFQNKRRGRKGFAGHHFLRAKSGAGFTLVEMLVAVALFAVVMSIIGGSLVTLIQANRDARALQIVMNNLSFAMDDMTRSMKVGIQHTCGGGLTPSPTNCPGGDTVTAFTNPDGDFINYQLNNNAIEKRVASGSFFPLTAPDVEVTHLMFYVTGAENEDSFQPKIVIVVRGNVQIGNKTKDFDIQTTVVQRAPNL